MIGTISVTLAVLFVLYCAQKLVKCGLKLGLYNFGEIGEAALGPRGKVAIDCILALC